MNWIAWITFIVNTITTLEPLVAQIWAEIQALINGGQPVPPALSAAYQQASDQLAAAKGSYVGIPPLVAQVPAHKAILATLNKTP